MAESLASIANRYGQYSTFGHKDYEAAKAQGYSDQDILNWLNADLSRLHERNRPGGPDGLYDEITRGAVDTSKSVNIVRPLPETTPEGMTGFEYDYQKSIDLANINKQIQNMVNESNKYIADVQARSAGNVATISAGATKYTADRQKEATTYVADREKETALGVENIRTKGALDLQDIVNAGLKDVETIRGQSARDVATIGGEFDIQGEEIKGETARDVAKIDREKGIYGSLISAFSF
jgi:hypothetical protein